ncbi:HTH-type transcriptional regulator Xre [Peptococcaceae bacterium CEB3]|nr:HTH-type transcriptional regulator Xre [Peptococcaceae bacterium CEB3]
MFNKEILSNRLRELRQQNKISMQQLANSIGLKSKAAVSQFENGANLPSIDTLFALADFFHVSLDYLVGRSDDPQRH